MARRTNVEYIIDEKGRKKAVVMSYRAYQDLLEDISDLRAIAERKSETPEDFGKVIADFKDAGRVR